MFLTFSGFSLIHSFEMFLSIEILSDSDFKQPRFLTTPTETKSSGYCGNYIQILLKHR